MEGILFNSENLSQIWDIIVIVLLMLLIIYTFSTMMIDTGMPRIHIERFFTSLVVIIIGFQFLFIFMYYLDISGTVQIFGMEALDLNILGEKSFLTKISTICASTVILLGILVLIQMPFMALYAKYFWRKEELRHNNILKKEYLLLLGLMILYSTLLININSVILK